MDKQALSLTVNGHPVTVLARPSARLIDVLRDGLGLTGTREGCSEGECGACTVIVDGQTVNSCLYLAHDAAGCEVLTIEGLTGENLTLSPVQQAFVDEGGIQCGFCTPGMIMSTHALLMEDPDPDDAAIREALVGNLCRCTGYVQIIDAVRSAAKRVREEESATTDSGGSHPRLAADSGSPAGRAGGVSPRSRSGSATSHGTATTEGGEE